jgi:pilus assembly protein FimV
MAAIAAACALFGTAAQIAFAADTASAPANAGSAPAVASGAQFTVQAGQSLNDVAIAVTQSHDRATLARAARALFDANPRAFMGHDPSRLKVGALLNVPALDASGAAASNAVAAWSAGVPATAATAAPASAAARASTAPATTAVASVATAQAQAQASAPGGASAAVSAPGASKPTELAPAQAPANASDQHMWTGAIQPAASAPAEAAAGASNASVGAGAADTMSPGASASRPHATVSSLQQLLALKNRVLMELQRHGIGAPAQPGTGSRAPVASVQSSASGTPNAPAKSNGASNAAVTVAPAPGPTAAARQPAEAGSFDWSQINVGAVSAAGAALLALIVGLAMRRRMRAGPAATAGGGAQDEATASHASAGATAAALDETPSTSADIFRAETSASPEARDASSASEAAATDDKEAELRAALVAAPESKRALMSLAELYAERRDAASFDEIAQRIWHLSGGRGPNWRRVASLGNQLDPHNPFYADGAPGAGTHAAPLASNGSDARQAAAPTHELRTALAGAAVSEEIAAKSTDVPGQAEAHQDQQPLARGESEGPLTPSAEPTPSPLPEATPQEPHDATLAESHGDSSTEETVPAQSIDTPAEPTPPIAFPPEAIAALGELDMPLPPRTELPHAEAAAAPPVSLATQPVVAPGITESQAVPPVEAAAPRAADAIEAGTAGPASVAGLGAGLGVARFGALNLAFDLELPPSPAQPLPIFTPEEVEKIARNKLDLAAEYIELGDLAGARALIHEVIESNDAGTRDEARALLSTLAPLS